MAGMLNITSEEIEFINRANIIIDKCQCRSVFIDPNTRNINIECPHEKYAECVQKLADQIGDYE